MIHADSLERAARYLPERTALAADRGRSTFRKLHERVWRVASALSKHGFGAGDRLAILLPNESDYIELVYGCAISTHPAVREVVVFGAPDPTWGETVKACVVLKPGPALTAQELITYCRRSLAHYKVPRNIEFSETELPEGDSGKILKRVLRDAAWSRQERAVA